MYNCGIKKFPPHLLCLQIITGRCESYQSTIISACISTINTIWDLQLAYKLKIVATFIFKKVKPIFPNSYEFLELEQL